MTYGIESTLEELLALRSEAAHLSFSARKVSRSHQASRHASRFRGRGMDYFETRPYVAGDDVRNIDWRVTARTGDLHSKVYIEERDRPVLLLVDFSPSMYFGTRHALKSVTAARLAALLSWLSSQNGDRTGGLLLTPAGEHDIRPGKGNRAVLKILSALSDATLLHSHAQRENQLEYALKHAAQVARPGSLIYLISDFFEAKDSLRQPLHRLAAHNDIISFFISDPIERVLPAESIPLSNGVQRMTLNPQHKTERTQIKAHYQQRIAWVNEELGKLGQPVIPVSTTDKLRDTLSQRSVQYTHA